MAKNWDEDCYGFGGWQRSYDDAPMYANHDGYIWGRYSDVFEKREAADQALSNLRALGRLSMSGPEAVIPFMGGYLVGMPVRAL